MNFIEVICDNSRVSINVFAIASFYEELVGEKIYTKIVIISGIVYTTDKRYEEIRLQVLEKSRDSSYRR